MDIFSNITISYTDIPKALYANKLFAMMVVKKQSSAFKILSQELQRDEDVILAINKPSLVLENIPISDLNEEICIKLVMKNSKCFGEIHTSNNNISERFYEHVFKHVIQNDYTCFGWFPESIKKNDEHILFYLRNAFHKGDLINSLQHVPDYLLLNKKIYIMDICYYYRRDIDYKTDIASYCNDAKIVRNAVYILFKHILSLCPEDVIEDTIIDIMKSTKMRTNIINFIDDKTISKYITDNIFLNAVNIGINYEVLAKCSMFIKSKSYMYIANIIKSIIKYKKHDSDIINNIFSIISYPDVPKCRLLPYICSDDIDFMIEIIKYVGNKKFIYKYGKEYISNEKIIKTLEFISSKSWNYTYLKNNKKYVFHYISNNPRKISKIHDILSKQNKNITNYFTKNELYKIENNLSYRYSIKYFDIFYHSNKFIINYFDIFYHSNKFIINAIGYARFNMVLAEKLEKIINAKYLNNRNIIMECINSKLELFHKLVKKAVKKYYLNDEKIIINCIKNNITVLITQSMQNNINIIKTIIYHKISGDMDIEKCAIYHKIFNNINIEICAKIIEESNSKILYMLPKDYQNIKPAARAIYRNKSAIPQIRNKEMRQYIVDINHIDRNILKYIENDRCLNIAMITNCNIIKKFYKTFIMVLSKKKLFLDINMHNNIIKYISVSSIISNIF